MDYFEIICHKDVTKEQIEKIIQLKEEHWKYGADSQREWINKNIDENDIHILGYLKRKGELISYSNLVNVKIEIDGEQMDCLGMGNVCVTKEYEHKGHAKEMLCFLDGYIRGCGRIGITLCKKDKIVLYSKHNWTHIEPKHVKVGGKPFESEVLFLNWNHGKEKVEVLNIDKNF